MKLALKHTVAEILLVLSFVAAASSLDAEAKTIKWVCTYPKHATPEGLASEKGFKLEFIFDDVTGKAALLGNNGLSDVDTHRGSGAITFMEKLTSGAVQTTTISRDYTSVHSRHSVVIDKLLPSQYYGRCVSN